MMFAGVVGRALSLLCVAMVAANCGAQEPAGTSGCQDVRLRPGDGGLYMAFGWDDAQHAFDKSAPVLVCVGAGPDRRVTLTGTDGISVSPREQTTGGQNVALRFEVTVQLGRSGKLTYAQISVASGKSLHEGLSVTVTASANGWRFGKPDGTGLQVLRE
jgi:hypothetical protein